MKKAPLYASSSLIALAAVLAFFTWKRATSRDLQAPSASPSPPSVPLPLQPTLPSGPDYLITNPSPEGTGKFYLGREIAKVVGHQAIGWLERVARGEEENPARAVELLKLKPDDIVADIGAGSGYYTFLLAQAVPEGKVIAVDIQPEMLQFIDARRRDRQIENIETHQGRIDHVDLPRESLDAALIVDAYHEFSHPWEMMSSITRALRHRGRVYLFEYRAEDPEVPIKALHKMTEAQAIKEMEAVGLNWVTTHRDLPWQHLMVFEKP